MMKKIYKEAIYAQVKKSLAKFSLDDVVKRAL
jgi:hypothetical protein